MSLHLHLCDRNTPLCEAWTQVFSDQALVTVHLSDFFAVEADVMVSGGNSLGYMDGGLELAIALKLGPHVQERLRDLLLVEHQGVLPVGQAVTIVTGDARWPILIHAPTMYLPMDVSETVNPYLAARAALRLCKQMGSRESQEGREAGLLHVLLPGLGTGVGRVSPATCALQMRRAYDEIVLGRVPRFESTEAAHADYRYLVQGGEATAEDL